MIEQASLDALWIVLVQEVWAVDGWVISFIVIFGIAALVPAVWSIVGTIQRKPSLWPALAGTCWAVALMLVFFIGMAAKWGGCDAKSAGGAVTCENCEGADPWVAECGSDCPDVRPGQYCPGHVRPVFDFCEKLSKGRIKQPRATWADLSFVAAGLWILWWFQFFSTPAANPMRMVGWLSVSYGMITIFMGPPSMLFHASLKEWGGWFDAMSVVTWLSFNAAYVVCATIAAFDKGRGLARTLGVLIPFAAVVVIAGFVLALHPDTSLVFYLITGVAWGLAEAMYWAIVALSHSMKYKRAFWLFGINVGTLVSTMSIWMLFHDGVVSASLCRDLESFPGHALFHILASFATILTFISFATEKRVTT